MHQPFLRRPAAWVALAAMLAALALPAHAMPSRSAMAGVGGDLCVGGKIVPASPVDAGATHGCNACCGSTASAPPRASASDPVTPVAQSRSAVAEASAFPTAVVRAALARAPPA